MAEQFSAADRHELYNINPKSPQLPCGRLEALCAEQSKALLVR